MKTIEEHIKAIFPELSTVDDAPFQVCWDIHADKLILFCDALKNDLELKFSYLSHITAIDTQQVDCRFEVYYSAFSFLRNEEIHWKTSVPINNEEHFILPSIANIYKGANWHEREIYDLFGIQFTAHPDLRRILLPEDWEGYPLRKDYVPAEQWHGLYIKEVKE